MRPDSTAAPTPADLAAAFNATLAASGTEFVAQHDGQAYTVRFAYPAGAAWSVWLAGAAPSLRPGASVDARPAAGLDRWYNRTLGLARRTGDAAFDREVMLIASEGHGLLRRIFAAPAARAAARALLAAGLTVSCTRHALVVEARAAAVPTDDALRATFDAMAALARHVEAAARPDGAATWLRRLDPWGWATGAWILSALLWPGLWRPLDAWPWLLCPVVLVLAAAGLGPLVRFARRGTGPETFDARTERSLWLLARLVCYGPVAAFVVFGLNAVGDPHPRVVRTTRVLRYTWTGAAVLSSWRSGEASFTYRLGRHRAYPVGTTLRLTSGPGLWGFEYVTSPRPLPAPAASHDH